MKALGDFLLFVFCSIAAITCYFRIEYRLDDIISLLKSLKKEKNHE
jgi:hypothetical protein